VYQTALAIVLRASGLQVERDVPLEIFFRGAVIASDKADVIVENKVLLELKSARLISPEHEAQLMNYLRCTGIEVGLLLNFGPRPQFKRIVFSNSRKRSFHSPTDA
jgi:GxxExxY protein